MRENLNISYEKKLGKSISEVTSISLDTDYDVNEKELAGKFVIEGTYKTHGLCLNQEEINFNIPFTYEIKEEADIDTVKLEVTDFTYNISSDTLCVDIDYDILYDEKNDDDEEYLEELDRYIKAHEIEIEPKIEDLEEDEVTEIIEDETEELEEEKPLEAEEEEECTEMENAEIDRQVSESIMESINETKEEYITYHVYICNENDTLESISEKYNIDINIIKEYNKETEIKFGSKLIIPYNND